MRDGHAVHSFPTRRSSDLLTAAEIEWQVIPDNFLIRLRGEDLDGRRFMTALERLGNRTTWEDEPFWRRVAGSLPGYRLSKFQADRKSTRLNSSHANISYAG